MSRMIFTVMTALFALAFAAGAAIAAPPPKATGGVSYIQAGTQTEARVSFVA